MNKNSNEDGKSMYECNICLEVAYEPVITTCGHLFCWPCMHKWLSFKTSKPECPVCKGGVSEKTLIPIFLRDSRDDPRAKNLQNVPKRPGGQRVEPVQVNQHAPRASENNRQNQGNVEVNYDVIATTIELSKKIKNAFLFIAPAESEDWRYLIMHMRLLFLLVVVFFVIAGLDI